MRPTTAEPSGPVRLGRVLAAVMIGAATLLGPRTDPWEHWATPPRAAIQVVVEDASDPDEPLDFYDLPAA